MDYHKELIKVFEEFIAALKSCDQKKLDSLISEEYVGFSLNGTVENKNDILENFKPGGVEISEYKTDYLKYDVVGIIGIITGKGTIKGSLGEYDFSHSVLFTDIYKRINEKWLYYKSQVTEIKTS